LLSNCARRAPLLALAGAAVGALLVASNAISEPLRLENPADVAAFRRWFTFLAEAQYYNNDRSRPVEIVDCSSLLRYAYREALRKHDAVWARDAHLPLVPALPSVGQYSYPRTPTGPNLFRIRSDSPSSIGMGQFASFADAKTLRNLNTFFVTRDIGHALPGDLLFFQTNAFPASFHSMIYLGPSQFQASNDAFVVYHTGPDGQSTGEIRRRSVKELMSYPEPRWRPTLGNPVFSGVFRWDILQ
jgi:uncharacterized protein